MRDDQVIALMAAILMAGDSAAQGSPPNSRPNMKKVEGYIDTALALFQAAQISVSELHGTDKHTV